ncbi:MAG TPA: bifunctional diaminohydroxyphosphoribosylaminopyrimidine deaminase/5-amino-6-(5-phosphoribosylamino)uracil reductase RibD [Flavobacterium sp.]|uniref:bifunctional diaminohydroxyphosphoribosylaminopyrimidine deaminase/5-amino-6-(5-phosphoribosylamino)uracil reductase RibD n=1 Tax=Flavobacterium sp. TaxID=239 RepID=UPI002BA45C58|nr:bifunctional diaminohydroxyphosphoribosylaminopyrimidine deaminase/5-amino-6-(5-phosphoribosylamino)uracil reductase RibD [Flavobacterium sp.]HNP32093.1 bifunctional diaminohydroxyphosphoribosylaminopyrimidine deaminase/5-amino-6-(5-phosphoribosylamino)uracil reductase RibD [Flavobacterium sp.]
MNIHQKYIKRCIELAKNGLGTTYPNPLVGSVIVYDNKIIGEGWHRKSGEPHAEVNAINSVKDKSLLSKATIYVSLEPCSHFGKTPPCCDLIIKHKIPNVVVGTIDPNSKVAGSGIKRLEESGAIVTIGVLEKECHELNKRFFTFHQKSRPYIILKWAESKDGFIAPLSKENKEPVWISNVFSRQLVHKWRSEEQAILVGTNTVLEDNPKLDVRDWTGQNPIRVILDRTGKISNEYFVKDQKTKTIILTEQENLTFGENCIYENVIFDIQLTKTITRILHKYGINSIIIEGGRHTLQSFIDDNLWDEARVFTGNILLKNGIKAPVLNGNFQAKSIKDDELKLYFSHD